MAPLARHTGKQPVAAIFDLDGTLLDTERLVIEAGLRTLEGHGFPVEREFLLGLVGVSEAEAQDRLAEHVGPGLDMARFDADWSAATRRAYAAGIPTMPGVTSLLAELAAREVPRAVGTNSSTEGALRKLGLAGIGGHFRPDHVVGFDSVARPKPDPDVFLEAADRLRVAPRLCVVFEDSDTGVAAALAAGMTVVQIPDQQARPRAGSARDPHHLAASILEGARLCGLID